MPMHRSRLLRVVSIIGCLSLLFVSAAEAQQRLPAITITVNNFNDSADTLPGDGICSDALNTCTLRAAIMEANALEPGSTILLSEGTYFLSLQDAPEDAGASGDLDITNSMSIQGSGDVLKPTIIDFYGNYTGDGGFHLTAAQPINVTISDMIIAWGFRDPGAVDDFTYGGNVWADGANITASLERVWILYGYAIRGGGLAVTNGANLTLDSSTVIYNNGGLSSGGIEVDGSTLQIVNSTIALNTAANGAGIATRNNANVTINNATIAYNSFSYGSFSKGGGIYNVDSTVNLSNTIVASNFAIESPDCLGTFASTGDNLIFDAEGCLISPDDLVDMAPMLDAFALYAPGNTPTFALMEGSPALDAGTTATCAPFDQRGVERPINAACDIGAYEGSLKNIVVNGSFEVAASGDEKSAVSWKVTNKGRRACNKPNQPISFDGECVFFLKGKAGQRSIVSQKLTGQTIPANTNVNLKFFLEGTDITGTTRFGAVVKYNDDALEPTKLLFNVPTGSGSGYLNFTAVTAGDVESIKLLGQYGGASGRLKIDAVSFTIPDTGTVAVSDILRVQHPLRAKSAPTIGTLSTQGYVMKDTQQNIAPALPLPLVPLSSANGRAD